ncbi:BnaA03g57300D [Brassica napus]|uniref:BnaA03g57300D protein n=1 Tax=Brassica napus TaxID=3708 RepID=A0A078JIL5_BRANA|nr:BnaA03g57300D [Brassica napus]
MRTFYPSDSCSKESHLNSLNPQSWLQVERGKLSSSASSSAPLCRESFIKVPEPQILPHYKPLDYVEVLSQIHEELESCSLEDRSSLYLLQYQVFRGLGETKLGQRSLRSAWQEATTVHEKVVFGSWLRYEKQGEEVIAELLSSCGKYSEEFVPLDIASYLPVTSPEAASVKVKRHISRNVVDFSVANVLIGVSKNLLLEVLVFANKFCCERLKDACDRELASLVSSMECAVELMDFALEESSPILAASCLQVFLYELPESLTDERVVEALTRVNRSQVSTMAGKASFSLYSCLTEVSMRLDPRSDRTLSFLEKVVDFAESDRQRVLGFHRLGCTRLLRKEYREAEEAFETALNLGHVYSATGLARIGYIQGHKLWGYEKLTSVISSVSPPLGWMYQERSLYCEGDKKLEDLEKATELDPTLTYPYMYRAVKLMSEQNAEAALEEINRILGFKLALECLEIRFCLYLGMDDYEAALRDIQAALTLCPDYRMFDGKVAARQLRTLVYEHVESWTTADCWMQLYEKWSNVDDIGSLSVIYQMLEADACKGVLYFRQSLLLLRLKCPEAAMRSLQLAREHASSDHERLVYEGWILYDTGHCEEGLQKAKESIRIKRSFEAYFLQAYALAESSLDPSSSSTVVSLLEDALKCPSDRLRKGQALNNLGSVYVDCEKLDLAADCYINALKVRHTRAHQGLARVHFLRNDKAAAYEEMTRLIEKAQNNASAYEKRSEYCDRELAKSDLEMVTRLDPLRVYPYRYRAAVLMDSRKEKEAIEELSRAIAFKADLHLLHLRAAFHEHNGDVSSALRDCRAALSVDPNHQEMLELHSRVNSHEP